METSVYRGGWRRWLGLAGGLVLLCAFAFFLARGYTPPGPLGEVLRHNQRLGIDANPLFYTEVEDSPNHSYQELFMN
ncbi:MAG: hypothetical protein ACYTG7_09730 [Planctomycetota bacterium]|jgi:hypothetical protein